MPMSKTDILKNPVKHPLNSRDTQALDFYFSITHKFLSLDRVEQIRSHFIPKSD